MAIIFDCPKCHSKESVILDKRTIFVTHVPIEKKNEDYYSLLSLNISKYPNVHVPVSDSFEQYIFTCNNCSEEFLYSSADSFSEEDMKLDEDKLKKLGLIK